MYRKKLALGLICGILGVSMIMGGCSAATSDNSVKTEAEEAGTAAEADKPALAEGETPDGELPAPPDGEMPDGEMPAPPDGELPEGEFPGEPPEGFGGERPELPEGAVPGQPPQGAPEGATDSGAAGAADETTEDAGTTSQT